MSKLATEDTVEKVPNLLLPCPWCGGTNVAMLYDDDFVTCSDCKVYGPDGGHAAWNTRAAINAMSDVREALTDICKRVFLAGHSEGWTGNQRRRDVQHVDAEKGWSLYVENGALAKALAALEGGE